MPDTMVLTCANTECGAENTITVPADDSWEAVCEPDPDSALRQLRVVALRLTVRCTTCGERCQYHAEAL